MSEDVGFWFLSHCRATKVQASLHKCAARKHKVWNVVDVRLRSKARPQGPLHKPVSMEIYWRPLRKCDKYLNRMRILWISDLGRHRPYPCLSVLNKTLEAHLNITCLFCLSFPGWVVTWCLLGYTVRMF